MPDLLLELFSEEIPARMQKDALDHLQKSLAEKGQKEGITVKEQQLQGFVTPRRVALWVKDLPASQSATETELKGPKVGAPEAALHGFLKKSGLQQNDLSERDGVYFAIVKKEGRQTADVLKTIIEEILLSFPWPKSMRWGAGEQTWVRPLHSILCIFDGKAVPVSFAGVTAGNITHGHRFLSPETITIHHPKDYEAALKNAHVIANRDARKALILEQAEKAAIANGLKLKKDEGLLEEVTGLVEWPVVLVGTIDGKFMDLPKEVLVSEMRAHQKYFALEQNDGALSDKFLITANMVALDGGKAIVAGNERVLRARLSDGRFFWDMDRKKPLSDWAESLKTVTYHAKLGTIADKVERIRAIALSFVEDVKGADSNLVEKAARLCKADLVTGMVGEFPELQGVMGRYYALNQKLAPTVADAIRDHYLPLGPASPVPNSPVSICISLADKLDTLVRMFGIGEKPTGSKDPFALRRSALGMIRIILENDLRIPLSKAIAYAGMKHATDQVQKELLDFFIDRLKVQLKDQDIRHDVIEAVVANGDDDLVRIVDRARALQDFLGSDDGANMLIAYRRAANILAIEEKKDKAVYAAAELQPQSLKEKEEVELAAFLSQHADRIENLRAKEQFVEAMKLLAELRPPVDRFFDKIMVNCDDKELRANRLRLLASIRNTMDSIANFALIEGETKEQKKAA